MPMTNFLFGFYGRVRRRDLWLFFILLALVYGGLFWQFGHFHVWRDMHMNGGGFLHSAGFTYVSHNPLIGLVALVAVWMKVAVLVKRWHDRDKSGWWVLITLIPFIGWIWQLIECGFLDGTPGSNKYGPSPKGLG